MNGEGKRFGLKTTARVFEVGNISTFVTKSTSTPAISEYDLNYNFRLRVNHSNEKIK